MRQIREEEFKGNPCLYLSLSIFLSLSLSLSFFLSFSALSCVSVKIAVNSQKSLGNGALLAGSGSKIKTCPIMTVVFSDGLLQQQNDKSPGLKTEDKIIISVSSLATNH